MIRRFLLLPGAAALALAGCATQPAAPPAAPPAPPAAAPVATPPPAPAPPAPPAWEDAALAPGDWRFTAAPAAEADYGEGAAAAFSVRCDPVGHRVLLIRPGAPTGTLSVRTPFGSRELVVGADGAAALPATDPFLDDIVFTRGRFAVEAAGLPVLTLPTWPEPARVIEECRS